MRPYIQPEGEASALARKLDAIWRLPLAIFALPVLGFGVTVWQATSGDPEGFLAQAGLAVAFYGLALGALAYWGHAQVEECHDLGTPNVYKSETPGAFRALLVFEFLSAVAFLFGAIYMTLQALERL